MCIPAVFTMALPLRGRGIHQCQMMMREPLLQVPQQDPKEAKGKHPKDPKEAKGKHPKEAKGKHPKDPPKHPRVGPGPAEEAQQPRVGPEEAQQHPRVGPAEEAQQHPSPRVGPAEAEVGEEELEDQGPGVGQHKTTAKVSKKIRNSNLKILNFYSIFRLP